MLEILLRDWVMPGTLIVLCLAISALALMPITLVIAHIIESFRG